MSHDHAGRPIVDPATQLLRLQEAIDALGPDRPRTPEPYGPEDPRISRAEDARDFGDDDDVRLSRRAGLDRY